MYQWRGVVRCAHHFEDSGFVFPSHGSYVHVIGPFLIYIVYIRSAGSVIFHHAPNQTVLSVIPPLALQEEMVVTDAFVAETGSSKQLRAGRIVRQRPRHDPVKPHLCKDQIRHFIQCLQRISPMVESTGEFVPDLATGGNNSLDIMKTDRADNLHRVLLPVYIKSDASTLH